MDDDDDLPSDAMDLDTSRPRARRRSSRRLYGSRSSISRFPRPNDSITRVGAIVSLPRLNNEQHAADEASDSRRSHSPSASLATDPSLSHLREISSLASWTVSSYKPGCGVSALLQPSTTTFWQSDGPQPHLLNIHFFKLVRIVKLRIYLDFEMDESYTPTRLSFAAGTHEYDAVEFAEWRWQDAGPKGWVDIDLSSCGSEDDQQQLQLLDNTFGGSNNGNGTNGNGNGNEDEEETPKYTGLLRCFFLQIRVLENHQNGKDTHIRGVQIFARDERVGRRHVVRPLQLGGLGGDGDNGGVGGGGVVRGEGRGGIGGGNDHGIEDLRRGLEEADWMGEAELR